MDKTKPEITIKDIYSLGLELYHSEAEFETFMDIENPFLKNKLPKDLCKTSSGRYEVYTYLGQIKHGIMR